MLKESSIRFWSDFPLLFPFPSYVGSPNATWAGKEETSVLVSELLRLEGLDINGPRQLALLSPSESPHLNSDFLNHPKVKADTHGLCHAVLTSFCWAGLILADGADISIVFIINFLKSVAPRLFWAISLQSLLLGGGGLTPLKFFLIDHFIAAHESPP